MSKTYKIIAIVIVVLLVIGYVCIRTFTGHHKPLAEHPKDTTRSTGLQQPGFHVSHTVSHIDTVTPSPTPTLTPVVMSPIDTVVSAVMPKKKMAPMRIYTSSVQPQSTPIEEYKGDYAPADRLIRCELINTVDSSNITTPIIGKVTDDLIWDDRLIISRLSEVHGTAQVDKSNERIAAEGAWTFTLFEPSLGRLGNRELVVKGYALDREDDPQFKHLFVGNTPVDTVQKTWGITNASAGLRGVIIKTNNADILNAFVSAFIGGMAGTVTQFSTVVAPEQGGSNVSLPSYVAAPAAQGISAVMGQYAQMVMNNIEKNGFFIRVPTGKLFYVYVTEDILTGKATMGGSRRMREVQSDFLQDREINEKVTQPRSVRDAKAAEDARNANPSISMDPETARKLDQANDALQEQASKLQKKSQQLAQPMQ